MCTGCEQRTGGERIEECMTTCEILCLNGRYQSWLVGGVGVGDIGARAIRLASITGYRSYNDRRYDSSQNDIVQMDIINSNKVVD